MIHRLFSIVKDATFSDTQLNSDLNKIVDWISKGRWCLILTPVSKPYRYVFPINATAKITLIPGHNWQKHLRLILDSKLDFNEQRN